jgi:hypothetical protein
MPYSSLARGNLNHNPIFEGVTYVAQYRYIAPGAPSSSSITTFNQTIDCPAIGPDRTLYLYVCTARSSAGPHYNTPTFNSRTMTVEIDTGTSYTQPAQWYSIKLLNSETTGTFTWTEQPGFGNIYQAVMAAYIVRGKRTSVAYSSLQAGGGNTGTVTLSINPSHPPYAKSIALIGSHKGIQDTSETSVYGSSSGFTPTIASYPMTGANGLLLAHGATNYTNLTASPVLVTYTVTWNTSSSIRASDIIGIVLY